ncbi:MAG TPA: tRNA (N6-isopentenyl adenosine(37)-C2)-methylthiotransferase MiaB [Saprospiraceae bacterium]|nr:tRNA (N6-isopentenyl adenosine(37)-C2)-methylthiotransferase MiaB [Saprospiraceae bacterium]HUN16513.1 tRNA (N6-isopentenyl adenosine(37)-C2)-methylthiotransferase MiaB [Saprospiraceae bacterium]
MYFPKGDHSDDILEEARQGEVLDYQSRVKAGGRQYYIESYGCQMNFSDSEIVASILAQEGLSSTKDISSADFVFLNTCSIREKAEDTVRNRLKEIQAYKKKNQNLKVGVLGCMAERLKSKFLEEEKLVDLVVGPDAYRDLPSLLDQVDSGEKGVNVYLSREETYADISPLRLDSNGVCAFISIMRGCDNMCSFCVVPFTRGRERSRDLYSIVAEAKDLFQQGFREVTLLGQNVDSYKWTNPESNELIDFSMLLEQVALVNPDLRIRFSTSHPKDITDEVLHVIAKYDNICNYIHLPVQSGNSRILKLMNRTYDRDWYLNRVDAIYKIIPDCAISSDMIAGFCSESDEEHQDTLSIMEYANYSYAYMFAYSERPGTLAAKKLKDDIPEEIKKQRLSEIIRLQRQLSYMHNLKDVGQTYKVLIEGNSKKSEDEFKGRNSQNKMIIFPKNNMLKAGDYVNVKIISASSATLTGQIVD